VSISSIKLSVACQLLLGVALIFVSGGAEGIDPEWSYEAGDDVMSIAVSADGEYIAAGYRNGYVYLFDKDNNTPLWSYTTGDTVVSVSISADGEYITVGTYSSEEFGLLYLFDKDSSTPLWSYTTGSYVMSAAISADGEYIVVGTYTDNKVYLFNMNNSTPLWSYTLGVDPYQGYVYSVAISADGEYIAAGARDGYVYLFDKDSSTPLWSYGTGSSAVTGVAISADGEYITAGSSDMDTEDNKVYLFDKDIDTPLWRYVTGEATHFVAISVDGEYIVAGSSNNNVYLFGRDNNFPLWSYATGDNVRSVAISANGEYIVAGSQDNKSYLFNKDSSIPLWSYETGGRDGMPDDMEVAISADGEYIVVGSHDNKIYLFERVPNSPPTVSDIFISHNLTDSKRRVYFWANYSDSDGNVTAFEWSSDINGILNTTSNFDSDDLSVGHHNISIRVMDDDGAWSDYVYLDLVIEEQEEECSFESFVDNIYVQSPSLSGPVVDEYMLLEVGKGSYHFVSEDNAYISWETTDLSGIKLDNGLPLPSKKLFTETTFDYENRIFTGKIDFTLEGGTYGGAASWDYQMIFSEDYTSIVGGQIYRFDSDGKIFYTWTFGVDGNYPYCALCTLTAADYYSENPFEDTTSPDEQVTIPEDGGLTLPFSGNPLAYGAIISILGLLAGGYAAMSARQSIPKLISGLQGLVDAGITDSELNSALEDLENMDGLGFFSNDRANAMQILDNYNEMTDQALGSMRQLDELQGVVDELQAAGVSSPELEAEIAEIESMLNSQVEGDTNKDFSSNLFDFFKKNKDGE